MTRDSHNKQPFESTLGEDLYHLACSQNRELVCVERIAGPGKASDGSMAFRLEFEGGVAMKGRRMFSTSHARKVAYWIETLNDPMLPTILGRHESALLLEWVSGAAIAPRSPFDSGVHGICAEFQARLHCTQDPVIKSTPPRFTMGELVTRFTDGCTLLHSQGLLDSASAAWLRGLAEKHEISCATTLVHNDLCGENLVLDTAGQVRVIDNEGLGAGFAANDLARTVYRWHMDPDTERLYLRHYERVCAADEFRQNRTFWMARVLVESARYRMEGSNETMKLPLSGIQRLLDGSGQGFSRG